MVKALLAILALSALTLAGCMGSTDPTTVTVTKTTTASMVASGQSAPLFAQLHGFFSDQPYLAAGSSTSPVVTPAHEWHRLPDGRLEYLHWDNADPAMATKLLFIGDTLPGPVLGCLGEGGVSQEQIEQGYTHFHKLHAANFDAGHHMDPANNHASGYWLRHISADNGSIFHGLDSQNLGPSNPLNAC